MIARQQTLLTRTIALSAALIVLATACDSGKSPAVMPGAHNMNSYPLYIGTYTQGWACNEKKDCTSGGIYRSTFDATSGTLSPPQLVATAVNPSYVAVHPSGAFLYAVNEVGDFGGQSSGSLTAYRVDVAGALTEIGRVSSLGADPCYVSVDHSGRFAFVANYGGGSIASYRIAEDGTLGAGASVQHTGSGPHANQKSPHAHFIAESSQRGRVYVADLGIDQVRVYNLDSADGKLTLNTSALGQLPKGSGPRHLAFHPSNKYVFVNNELSSTVTVFAHDAGSGGLKELQTVSTVPTGFTGANNTAEILVSADGKFVYVSNRGHNSIAVFPVDETTGQLALLEATPSGGDWPRDFKFDPTGNFLLVEHQKSDNIVVLRVDRSTGKLTPTGHELRVSKPVSIAFMPFGARE